MSSSTSPANLPSFIDTASCLCGLLESQSTLPDNGNIVQLWRCIGDANDNISSGGHGKWYNTTLPSQELSGLNQPQNWGENPPNTTVAYVLEGEDGNVAYVELGSEGSPSLIGKDTDCTGRNDTEKSAMYYARGANGTTSSSASSSSQASSMSSASSMASSASATATSGSAMTTSGMPTTSATDAASTASSASSSGSASTGTSSSAATHFSVTSALLVGMVFAPLVSFMM